MEHAKEAEKGSRGPRRDCRTGRGGSRASARLLVVGAGASIEECIRGGIPVEDRFPSIGNFARQLWRDDEGISAANQFVGPYLLAAAWALGSNPLDTFKRLEAIGETNVERFFAWGWSTIRVYAPSRWRDLIKWCLFEPFNFLLMKNFWVNGAIKPLNAGLLVAARLEPDDIVLNLNYDVLFDIALRQHGFSLTYAPNRTDRSSLLVCKPHGSFNLYVNTRREIFAFGDPLDLTSGVRTPDDEEGVWENEPGYVPPRFGKDYTRSIRSPEESSKR
jgi:hypothetical protein